MVLAPLWFAFVALPSLAPLRAQEAPPPLPALADVPDLADLPARWSRAMEQMGVPGCAVVVVQDGDVLGCATLGVRNLSGEPVDADTLFYVASVTKTFTAAALAALAEDGRLELDAAVEEYLPRFTLADEQTAWSVTVRDLLCHRPGLHSFPIVFLDAYTGEISEDRYYHWLAQVEPTNQVEYSNIHYTLAGRVIEARTGKRWQDVLAERIFQPAGMTRTTAYASRMYSDTNAALPLEAVADGFVACETRKSDRTMHAAGGTGTTARDAARWLLLQLGEGAIDGARVYSSETARELVARHSEVEPSGQIRRLDGFGLAWQLGTYRGRPYATHGGGYAGTAAHFSFLPEERLGVVVLANAAPAGQALCDVASIDVYDRLLGVQAEDLLPAYVARGRAVAEAPGDGLVKGGALSLAPAAYAGRFVHPHWGTLEVALRAGELQAAVGELALRLSASGPEAFDGFNGRTRVPGRFLLEGQRVVAVELDLEGTKARFEPAADGLEPSSGSGGL